MAIITCKECSNQISSSAETCPHCAYPIKKKQIEKANTHKTIGLLVIAVIFLLMYQFGWIEPIIQKLFGSLIP